MWMALYDYLRYQNWPSKCHFLKLMDDEAVSCLKLNFLSVQAIIDERCDGGRNIFHAAVSMCQPTSNKDSDQDVYSSQNSGSTFASSFDIEPSLTSRAMNLRDMMRRAAVSQR